MDAPGFSHRGHPPLYGDGTPALTVFDRRVQFAAWSALYTSLSILVHSAGPKYSQLWRHASYWWAILINMSIIRHSLAYPTDNHFIEVIAWCNFIGNASYLYSCWGLYKSWYSPLEHPIRFFMVTTCFIPAHLNNIFFIINARRISSGTVTTAVDSPTTYSETQRNTQPQY